MDASEALRALRVLYNEALESEFGVRICHRVPRQSPLLADLKRRAWLHISKAEQFGQRLRVAEQLFRDLNGQLSYESRFAFQPPMLLLPWTFGHSPTDTHGMIDFEYDGIGDADRRHLRHACEQIHAELMRTPPSDVAACPVEVNEDGVLVLGHRVRVGPAQAKVLRAIVAKFPTRLCKDDLIKYSGVGDAPNVFKRMADKTDFRGVLTRPDPNVYGDGYGFG